MLSFRCWDKTNCGLVLSMLCMSFFLPWKLVVFYCLILGLPFILLMLLGKNNGKTRAESVMMGWKVRLLNLYQCVGFGFARLIGRFIISTSKLTSGNSSLCCFDSLSYLLAPFLVFLPSFQIINKIQRFFAGVCLVCFFANVAAVAALLEGWD